jgi:hypothetical protein
MPNFGQKEETDEIKLQTAGPNLCSAHNCRGKLHYDGFKRKLVQTHEWLELCDAKVAVCGPADNETLYIGIKGVVLTFSIWTSFRQNSLVCFFGSLALSVAIYRKKIEGRKSTFFMLLVTWHVRSLIVEQLSLVCMHVIWYLTGINLFHQFSVALYVCCMLAFTHIFRWLAVSNEVWEASLCPFPSQCFVKSLLF